MNNSMLPNGLIQATVNDDPYQIKWKVNENVVHETSHYSSQNYSASKITRGTARVRPIVRITTRTNVQKVWSTSTTTMRSQEQWIVSKIPNPLQPADAKLQPRRRKRNNIELPPLPEDIARKMEDMKKDKQQKFDPSQNSPSCASGSYELSPSLKTLSQMTDSNLAKVKNFRINNNHVGSIEFLEPVDLRNVDIDKIVTFNKDTRSMQLYDNESLPNYGEGLNVRAQIILLNIYPKHKDNPKKVERYCEKLKEHCQKADWQEFINYSVDSGRWKFIVKHF